MGSVGHTPHQHKLRLTSLRYVSLSLCILLLMGGGILSIQRLDVIMLPNLTFTAPWLLGFFAVLPLLWWLLRLTPPAPRKVLFPALMLLKNLMMREETPARSPWWLLLLRLGIAALLILACAQPVIDPQPMLGSKGALLIAVDNDWASARDWEARQNILRDLLHKANNEKRAVFLLLTTPPANGESLAITAAPPSPDTIAPEPWNADLRQATERLRAFDNKEISETVWLASGLGSIDSKDFYAALQTIAPTKIYGTTAPIYALSPPVSEGDTASIPVTRAATDGAATIAVNAIAKDGNIIAHWPVTFVEGAPRVMQPLDLPPELRNRVARFEIDNQRTAASTVLLDASWEHRAIGIVGDAAELDRHSLLSEIFYIDRAVKPYADIRVDTLDNLLTSDATIIALTDTATISDDTLPSLTAWIKRGGILLRFAGDRFAASDHAHEAALLPAPIRAGGRSLGGAMTWAAPQKLQSFPANSPFHTLPIPDDVSVSRQVLAEPSTDLTGKTWASLDDGTPLVTGAALGQGLTILFHIPAREGWSNLPLSGLFVDMLRRIIDLSRSPHTASLSPATTFPPYRMLDAFGDTHTPSTTVLPLTENAPISPRHPPGLYGTEANNVALNLGAAVGQPEALRDVPLTPYTTDHRAIDLQPALLLAAFLLLLGDGLISLRLRGFLKMALLLGLLTGATLPALAASEDQAAITLSTTTTLAYVPTGDAATDRASERGLRSLAAVLQNRTSLDTVNVARVDPSVDDLSFFPLLYWPVITGEKPLSPEGAQRVTHYLHHGGMILFDAGLGGGENAAPVFLQQVLSGVDLPPLVRLPETHVLKRSFYLLDTFPGRFDNPDFWLEPEESAATDGVASVLYGSNGWAAAWALDESGRPLYPCAPNGEPQRERAFRFGVNLVLYALTGNYKADQVHAAALLEKVGK